MKILRFTFLILSLISFGNGYNILGIFHTTSKSHFIVISGIMKELALRGHNVTVLAPFSIDNPPKNYKHLKLENLFEAMKEIMQALKELCEINIFRTIPRNYMYGFTATEATLQEKSTQNLLESDEKFDLIILEIFMNEAFMGFLHKFNAPFVGIAPFGASQWTNDVVGSPSPPSYIPNPFIGFTDRMSLKERFINFIVIAYERLYYDFIYIPKQEKLYEKYFPDRNKPKMLDLWRKGSLALLNSHFSIGFPRPNLPNMIEVGGVQITSKKNHSLPKDLQEFLDSAKDGVIYFSMGTNLKPEEFLEDKSNALINAFKSIENVKILMKWDDKNLTINRDNILIKSWFPQADILAHPNLKLFITHGGLLSTTEAIYHSVPVLGIPMFADQFLNMAQAERAGFGLTVNFKELTEKKLADSINEMLTNSSYAETVKEISRRFYDQPMTPMDTAIFWIEYVIRHKGAPFLRAACQDLSFIEYHNIDVITILVSLITFIVYVIYKLILLVTFGTKPKKEKTL